MIEQARRRQFLEMHRRSGNMTRAALIKHITSATAHGGAYLAHDRKEITTASFPTEELRKIHARYHEHD